MRWKLLTRALVGVAIIALPVAAAIKAMTLKELMSITSDVVHGTIVSTQTFKDSRLIDGAVYTRLEVEGESLRSGKTGTWEITFLGSHDKSDEYMTSEMPSLRDTRVGGEGVFFIQPVKEFDGQDFVYDWSGAYRVERGFGEPVLIGKGDGAAFPVNTKLVDVRDQVRKVHLEIEAAKQDAPGLKK